MCRVSSLRLFWLVPLAFGLLSGCHKFRSDTPPAAFQAFVRALEKDERATALGLLSEPTRRAFEARAREVAQASGGTVRADVESLFFGLPLPAAPIERLAVVTQTEETATLQVSWSNTVREYQMVREPSGWKLDLPLPKLKDGAGPADPR